MDNSIFKDEINYWDNYFINSKNPENRLFELAFFKIFVKFELFVSEIFVHYCIGNQSVNLYSPVRKLNFTDRNHFDCVIKNKNSNYIDYFSKMNELAPYVFEEENSPFIIFNDPTFNQNINQMRTLRNYIAHESNTSKAEYLKQLLNGRFKEPYEFLLKNRKGKTISNYTYYTNSLIEISDYLLGPNPES